MQPDHLPRQARDKTQAKLQKRRWFADVNASFPKIVDYSRRIYAGMVKTLDDAVAEVRKTLLFCTRHFIPKNDPFCQDTPGTDARKC
jgi:hypothetical protein